MDKEELKYTPKDLKEAIIQLDREFDDSTKSEIMNMDEDEFTCDLHFSTGTWIRNNWGLWQGGDLVEFFTSLGINHPDDMSSIILKCYYRHLKNQDYDLDKQIKFLLDYWNK